jgi:SAM-dependent methyltransferase
MFLAMRYLNFVKPSKKIKMKKWIESLLNYLGYVLIKKQTLFDSNLSNINLSGYDLANARGKMDGGLQKILTDNNKERWLDVGTGGNDADGFDKIDIIDFPEGRAPKNYRRLDIINCSEEELNSLGKYDLVRMQHVFEHFTPEDGLKVLKHCAFLLNPNGYILISCPDIDIVIKNYLNGNIRQLNGTWGLDRIGEDAPDSFYLSVFCHSVLSEPHLWCYNAEGIIFQLNKTKQFYDCEILALDNHKSSIPFTHNRPSQDVVVLAKRK